MFYKEYVTYTDRLSEITVSILKIYDKLITTKQTKDLKQYNEYFNYLKIAIFTENNIYSELNLKDEDDIELFLSILNFRLKNKKLDKENIDKIINRIENYFAYQVYINPKASNDQDTNVYKILNNSNCDYTINIINEFISEINTNKDEELRNQIIYSLYTIISSNKYIENKLLNNKVLQANGKEKLLRGGQNLTLINSTYKKFLVDTFKAILGDLVAITNNSLPEDRKLQTLNIIALKSCLKISNTETFQELSNIFYNDFLKSNIGQYYNIISSNSISKMSDAFNKISKEQYLNIYDKNKINTHKI